MKAPPGSEPQLDREPPPRASWALLAAVIAFAVAFHALWFSWDRRIPFMDQHRYYEMSRQALAVLNSGDAFSGRVLDLHPSHPPAYSLLAALLMKVAGSGYQVARTINLFLVAASILITYQLGRPRLPRMWSVLAALIAVAAPLAAAFGHVFYIEALLVPSVGLAIVVLDRFDGSRPLPHGLGIGALLGLGCLVKWTFPIFLAGPVLVWGMRHRRPATLTVMVAAAALIAGPWYIAHRDGIATFLGKGVTGGEGWLSAQTGWAGLSYYPKQLVLVGLGIPLSLVTLWGSWQVVRRPDRRLYASLLLAVLIPLVVFGCVLTKKPRHLLPLIPVLALFAAEGLRNLRQLRGGAILCSVIVGHLVVSAAFAGFAPSSRSPKVLIAGLKVPLLSEPSPMPGPPDATTWPYEQIIQGLQAVGAGPASPVLLLCNLTPFREEGFWLCRDEQGLNLPLGLVPFAWPDGHPAHSPFPLLRLDAETPGLLDAEILLGKTGLMWVRYGHNLPIHQHGARIREAIAEPDGALAPAFSLAQRVALPDGSEAQVLRSEPHPHRNAIIARFVLRFEPGHGEALALLGWIPSPTSGQPTDDELVQLGVIPEGPYDVESLRGRWPLREDLWIRAAQRGSADAEEVLAHWNSWRVGPDPVGAALELARWFRNDQKTSARWALRAAEADRSRHDEVRKAAGELGFPIPAEAPLLEELRTRAY